MLWYMSTRMVSVPVSNSPKVDFSCTAALQVDTLSWEVGSAVVTQKQLAAVVSLVAAASGAQRVH